MRIGIDARLYGLEHTGIGRYVMQLVHGILRLDKQNQYVLFINSKYKQEIPKQENLTQVISDIRHYTLKEQVKFPAVIANQSLDLIHFPHFNVPLMLPIPFLVTIHDLLWHDVVGYQVTTLNPLIYSAKYLGYRIVVRNAINKSQRIFTPSNWVKQQLLQRFKIANNKVIVAPEGVDKSFTQTKLKLLPTKLDLQINQPFIVYTGSLYPHKNVATLLKALRRVNLHCELSLVLVSARSIFTPSVRKLVSKLGLQDKVVFAGFLPDAQLKQLYQKALALVQPSTSEGFGLTGLEAMATGLPVISSTAACLPEIYEEAALFFKTKDDQDLSDKIIKVVSSSQLRDNLILAGKKQANEYSWKKMAQQTLKVYTEVGKLT